MAGSGGQGLDLQTLLQEATRRSWPKRTIILRQGEKNEKFFFIVKGWVRLYNITPDGEEILGGVLGAGDILGDISFFYSVANRFFAVALEDTVIGELPAAVMREKINNNPQIAEQLMALMTRRIYSLRIENGNLAHMDAQKRLSCLLLRLSSWMKGRGGSFPLPYDKSIVAEQLGMEPATLSRTLAKLEERSVTSAGPEIQIRDFSSLSEYCCVRCPVPAGECPGRRCPSVAAV